MKETTDIWLASFIRMKGHNVADFEVISKNKAKFKFEVSDEEWRKLKMAFDVSDISKIKLHQIALKDLIH